MNWWCLCCLISLYPLPVQFVLPEISLKRAQSPNNSSSATGVLHGSSLEGFVVVAGVLSPPAMWSLCGRWFLS